MRRILACQDIEELCRILRPTLTLIQSKGEVIDYANLLEDLCFFERDTQRKQAKWAQWFYGVAFKKQQEGGCLMLYASVLELDRQASKALKVTDLYALHRVVYSLFEDVRTDCDKNGSVPSGIQWVDKGGDAFQRNILMLSDREPRASHVALEGKVRSKPLSATFLQYPCYRFEVVMNPTKRARHSSKNSANQRQRGDWYVVYGKSAFKLGISS